MDAHKYPVYIIAHNPNTIADMDEVLAAGVNAIEPDVQYNEHTKSLCIAHDAPGKSDHPPSVELYLEHVKLRLGQYPGLSLILFDIKLDKPAYNNISVAAWGKILYDTANRILHDTGLVMIFSVSKTEQVGVFADFALSLQPKQALMIDQESDVEKMIQSLQPFSNNGLTNIAYADGNTLFLPDLDIARHIREALYRRVLTNTPRFISTWVLESDKSILYYLRMGVDGMIVSNESIKNALQIVASPEFSDRLRLAERRDNPFQNQMLNYGIEITTLDKKLAGTDAVVSCTLSGPERTTVSIIDSRYKNLFETGAITQMTIKMLHAGTPLSITLSHDGSGKAADWLPDIVHVTESKTKLNVYACFGDWIQKNKVHTRELGSFKYTLKIHTSDIASAGTDAGILFTLEGAGGSVKRKVMGNQGGLFERDHSNVVEIPGMDIGIIHQLTVETDGSGVGADWHLDAIEVLVNGISARTFVFNQWITVDNPVKK